MGTNELQLLFGRASKQAERGEYSDAANSYGKLLKILRGHQPGIGSDSAQEGIRSTAFNLAQVDNKLEKFQEALEMVELGLSSSPNERGRAVGLAAKGEALYGLKMPEEGKAAFEEAVKAHPFIGRLNAADSITRLPYQDLLPLAEQWVISVQRAFGSIQDPQMRAEASTVLGKIESRRGNDDSARGHFNDALSLCPSYEDAKLQLRMMNAH